MIMRAIIFVLIVAAALAPAGARVIEVQPPVADAYTNNSAYNTNYGSATVLQSYYDDVPNEKRTFIRFELPTLEPNEQVTKATLTAWIESTGEWACTGHLQCRAVSTSWQENTITWNNQPATTGNYGSRLISGMVTTVQYDVTTVVQSWYAAPTMNYGFGFVITISRGDAFGYYAKVNVYAREYEPSFSARLTIETNSTIDFAPASYGKIKASYE
jgi:hypothetical protein